jgi:hypothetical protein
MKRFGTMTRASESKKLAGIVIKHDLEGLFVKTAAALRREAESMRAAGSLDTDEPRRLEWIADRLEALWGAEKELG